MPDLQPPLQQSLALRQAAPSSWHRDVAAHAPPWQSPLQQSVGSSHVAAWAPHEGSAHAPAVQVPLQQLEPLVHAAPDGAQVAGAQLPSASQLLLQHALSAKHACPSGAHKAPAQTPATHEPEQQSVYWVQEPPGAWQLSPEGPGPTSPPASPPSGIAPSPGSVASPVSAPPSDSSRGGRTKLWLLLPQDVDAMADARARAKGRKRSDRAERTRR